MNNSILVIGGGISGMTAAIEAAECGRTVYLIEREPWLGGRVARMNKYFPKLCPPYCGLEINFRRIRANPDIRIFTLSQVVSISGQPGDFTAVIKTTPRYVNQKCVACDDCVKACPVSRPDRFNYGMSQTRAIYLPHQMAMPMRHVIDMDVCEGSPCGECVKVCKYGAIELEMKDSETTVQTGSVVYATGWKPYDASKIANLGYREIDNVITNVEMERLAAVNGPTGGRITRRDNGEPVKTVAFVQCAGSRDDNHLPYCSSVCCLASLKQARYVRDQYPDSEVYIFYIDLRAPGKHESFYNKVKADPNIHMVKGKVGKIDQGEGGTAIVTAEDILGGGKIRVSCDLVVLATGMEPTAKSCGVPLADVGDEGFITENNLAPGAIPAGVAAGPFDVTTSIQNATGAALKAIQASVRR